MNKFTSFPINRSIIDQLSELNIHTPTAVQEKTFSILLPNPERDIHAQAQTGTGKTFAFGIPLLEKIMASPAQETQALILAPTRELAVQIYENLAPLARKCSVSIDVLYGGVSLVMQCKRLKKNPQLIVGTPGRIIDLVKRKALSLKTLSTVVLDEADIMLDMGFREDIEIILKSCPVKRSIWLFSATVKDGIADLKKRHMHDPALINVSTEAIANKNTDQFYCIAPDKNLLDVLVRFLINAPEFYGFIFCPTKLQTSEIARALQEKGFQADALHGDLSQAYRNRITKDFKEKKFTILVATDVAARGIDVQDITHVINYHAPEDVENYVHRIGRTGRAGKKGIAITLLTPRQRYMVKLIEKKFKLSIAQLEIPTKSVLIEKQLEHIHSYIQKQKIESPEHDASKKTITQIVQQLSDEKKITLLAHLIEEKFFKCLDQCSDEITSAAQKDNNSFTELSIPLGQKDGIDPSAIRRYLMHDLSIAKHHIQRIRVINKRSFIIVAPTTLSTITAQKFRGFFWRTVTA